MVATCELNGQELILLNGGPHFKFTEALSFTIHCDDQKEVDYYWGKLRDDEMIRPRCQMCSSDTWSPPRVQRVCIAGTACSRA